MYVLVVLAFTMNSGTNTDDCNFFVKNMCSLFFETKLSIKIFLVFHI